MRPPLDEEPTAMGEHNGFQNEAPIQARLKGSQNEALPLALGAGRLRFRPGSGRAWRLQSRGAFAIGAGRLGVGCDPAGR